MKTAAKFRFAAVLAALVVVAFWFSACPPKENVQNQNRDDWTFKLSFKGTSRQDWVPVNTQKFDDALCNLDKADPNNPNGKKGEYDIKFKANPHASETPNYHPPTCTPSGAAQNSAADASAANDPNVTQHIRVQSAKDLEAVLAAFASPTP